MKGDVILFCYDGSEESKHAIEAAAKLLTARDAIIVDVGEVLTRAESLAALSPGVDVSVLENVNEDAALERAQAGATLARRFGFDAQPRGVVSSPTWDGILNLADEVDAAVIVVGSRGLTGVRELVEGSTSRALAKHSTRPVLVIPPVAAAN
jgi:nucleotide-binding universal stress UspA family protein